MTKIRVLIADDHAVLRSGLRMLLNSQPDIEVIGEASDGKQAVEKTAELSPDVLLLDLTMPGIKGIDVIRMIKAKMLPVVILVLTMHENESFLLESLKAGALGYIPKKAADTELVAAIRAVYHGEVFVHSSLTKAVVKELVHPDTFNKGPKADSYEQLSQRERETLQLVAQGYTNQDIAARLYVSTKTVETYKARVMAKLELHSRVELVRYALQRGLLTDSVNPSQ